ncbi:MAG: DUF4258 domain-containing protein [Candidatus Poribacteria bacterium]|nr:DUF4258 domain-containing protein [Candidatus Poribacteria bacterium]
MPYLRYRIGLHAAQEMLEENVTAAEIEAVLLVGERIEDYPDDPRGHSYLLFGLVNDRPIYVCAADKDGATPPYTFIITVYEVNLRKRVFADDFKTRLATE